MLVLLFVHVLVFESVVGCNLSEIGGTWTGFTPPNIANDSQSYYLSVHNDISDNNLTKIDIFPNLPQTWPEAYGHIYQNGTIAMTFYDITVPRSVLGMLDMESCQQITWNIENINNQNLEIHPIWQKEQSIKYVHVIFMVFSTHFFFSFLCFFFSCNQNHVNTKKKTKKKQLQNAKKI